MMCDFPFATKCIGGDILIVNNYYPMKYITGTKLSMFLVTKAAGKMTAVYN